MIIEIYTDGSATTADKPGGWAYVVVIDGTKYTEGYGHADNVTNNDMELEAAIQGLQALRDLFSNLDFRGMYEHILAAGPEIVLVADSQLVLGWITGAYRFKQEAKRDKFTQLQLLVNIFNVKTRWVEGHSGNEFNERCDELANFARTGKLGGLAHHKKKKAKPSIGDRKDGIICIWYKNQLKIIDLDGNIVENYDESVHGDRSSSFALQG
jgi:ribonuclease HI